MDSTSCRWPPRHIGTSRMTPTPRTILHRARVLPTAAMILTGGELYRFLPVSVPMRATVPVYATRPGLQDRASEARAA